MSIFYKGKHRKEEETPSTTPATLSGSLVSEYVDASNCKHPHTITLAGRVVCNTGCGADLGPANG